MRCKGTTFSLNKTDSFRGMVLSVIWDDYHFRYDGKYYCPNTLWKFFDALSQHWAKVILSTPVRTISQVDAERLSSYEVKVVHAEYSDRPFYRNKFDFLRRLPVILLPTISDIAHTIASADVVLIRLPSAVGLLAYALSRFHGKPALLYIAGDLLHRNVGAVGSVRGGTRIRAILAWIYDKMERLLVSRAPALVLGDELFDRYRHLGSCVKFHMNVLESQEILSREDTCSTYPVRLLFVGKLIPIKGVFYLLEALHHLPQDDFILEVVGDGELLPLLMTKVRQEHLEQQVIFRGPLRFGEQLFETYRQADIFVCPSLSEGVPKVLLEAMAFSLPIVATRVGGVPGIVVHEENGLLVPPGSSEDLARAIIRIATDGELRRRMIRNNHLKVQDYTVDAQVRKFMDIVTYFLSLSQAESLQQKGNG